MNDNDIIEKAENLLKSGKTFEAYNVLNCSIEYFNDNLKFMQLYGLSLARLGATHKARLVVSSIYEAGHKDSETSGILGRIYKDLWKKTGDVSYALLSRDIYYNAFLSGKSYYTGINAATMSLIVGQRDLSLKIVSDIVLIDGGSDDYWYLASMGEAYLLMDNYDQSEKFYKEAFKISKNNFGNISSTFLQLLLISEYKIVPRSIIDLFKPPAIIVFSGHMIDKPDRKNPRFTENMVSYVQEEIRKELDSLEAKIGYSSAACGTDTLFVEEMKKRGAETNVILPFNVDDFINTSIGYAGNDWIKRFGKIIETSCVTYITEENYLGCDELFSFTNDIIVGMAYLRSSILHTKPILLAVIDSTDKEIKCGGASELVKNWSDKENLRIIDINKFEKIRKESDVKPVLSNHNDNIKMPYGMKRSIKCIMFADIAGFSKIQEEFTPYFMHELLDTIGKRYKDLTIQPEIINTWGDAIFTVYSNAKDLMEFALLLRDTVMNVDWSEKKLPELNIRISLHAGPIYMGMDSITNRMNAYGAHINRAARMEPITVPGCIYSSIQFAAKLVYETGDDYLYEYVGILDLPKHFGKQEMFHISRKRTV